MSKACLVCNALNLEMISIFRHTKNVDKILSLLLGLQAKEDDHLCKDCCNELITAFDLKQNPNKCNPDELNEDIDLENKIIPIEDQDEMGILSDSDVHFELESDNDLSENFEVLNENENANNSVKIKNNLESKSNDKLEQEVFLIIESDSEEVSVLDKSENVTQNPEIHESVKVSSSTETNKPRFMTEKEIEDLRQTSYTFDRRYKCPDCGKRYGSFVRLKYHIYVQHRMEKKFTCSTCNKSFVNVTKLKQHAWMHTAEYACTYCSKCFQTKRSLQSHIKYAHINYGPKKCSDCGKECSSITTLKRHQMVHTGEKPHSCSECGKEFRTHTQLKYHKRNHTGEKPYACDYCIKRYAHETDLKIHLLLIHKTEKNVFNSKQEFQQFNTGT